MKLTVAELFAGVGGFRIGLNHIKEIDTYGKAVEKGDWDIVYANQFEPSTKTQHAYNCYITRFGEEHTSNVDINLENKTKIPKHSLLVGGFPCQDYSVARSLSNEKGIEGKKGVLFWQIKEILINSEPPFVLLENVDRLLKSPSNKRGRDFSIMLKTFDELGYCVEWRVINAADYSMPQKRKRVFIFAFKKNTKYYNQIINKELNYKELLFNKVFPVIDIKNINYIDLTKYIDVLEVSNEYNDGKYLESGIMINGKITHFEITPQIEKIYSLGQVINKARKYIVDKKGYIIDTDKLEKWKYLKSHKKIERITKTGHKYIYSEGQMAFPDNLEVAGRTMLTSEGTLNRSSHIIYDKEIKEYRILTEIETELLQMFPINWTNTMPKRNRYFMMGNALVTGIIARLEPYLKEILLNE